MFCLATLIPVSLAFQHHQAGGQPTLIPRQSQTVPNQTSDWEKLKRLFQSDFVLGWETCSGENYEAYYKWLPEFHLESLRLPSNAKILYYGQSLMHQTLDNILIANGDTLVRNGPFGGVEGKVLLTDVAGGVSGYVTQWDFTTNTTILEIQNYPKMQRAENIGELKDFLWNHGPFDIAFFMNPHTECYWSDTCEHADGRLDYVEARPDADPLWEVVHEAAHGNAFEVDAWSWVQRTVFHADSEHVIHTTKYLSDKVCNIDDNCNGNVLLNGHQCQPGQLAFISADIAKAVRNAVQDAN